MAKACLKPTWRSREVKAISLSFEARHSSGGWERTGSDASTSVPGESVPHGSRCTIGHATTSEFQQTGQFGIVNTLKTKVQFSSSPLFAPMEWVPTSRLTQEHLIQMLGTRCNKLQVKWKLRFARLNPQRVVEAPLLFALWYARADFLIIGQGVRQASRRGEIQIYLQRNATWQGEFQDICRCFVWNRPWIHSVWSFSGNSQCTALLLWTQQSYCVSFFDMWNQVRPKLCLHFSGYALHGATTIWQIESGHRHCLFGNWANRASLFAPRPCC